MVVELRNGDHLPERLFRDVSGRGRQVDRRGGRRLGAGQRDLPGRRRRRRQRPPLLRDPAADGDRRLGNRRREGRQELDHLSDDDLGSERQPGGAGIHDCLERSQRTHHRRRHRDQRRPGPSLRVDQSRSRCAVGRAPAPLRSADRHDSRVRALPRSGPHLCHRPIQWRQRRRQRRPRRNQGRPGSNDPQLCRHRRASVRDGDVGDHRRRQQRQARPLDRRRARCLRHLSRRARSRTPAPRTCPTTAAAAPPLELRPAAWRAWSSVRWRSPSDDAAPGKLLSSGRARRADHPPMARRGWGWVERPAPARSDDTPAPTR